MAKIIDGIPVDAANTNPAFLGRDVDDTATGKIDFANGDSASGVPVVNIQREVNSNNSFSGRASGSAHDAKPNYTENQGFVLNEDLFSRVDALSGKMNNSTGHAHSGIPGDGVQISAPNLVNVPLAGYFQQGVDLTGVTGDDVDVSTEMSGKNPSGGSSSPGVVVDAPYNKVILRQGSGADEDDQFVDGDGNVVYGRITEASSVWTLSFFVLDSGVETAYSFVSSVDIKWYYQELYNPMLNPPIYSELAIVPSDNPTQDILDATTTVKGKVNLATAVQPVSGTGSAGTPDARVANADHTHEGVHSVGIDGDPTQALGDVKIKAGNNIQLSWDAGKLKIATDGAVGYQEIPSGTVDGVNSSFGPLTFAPSNANSVLVFIDFVAVPITTGFTISGSTITFQAGWIPQLGQSVYVFYLTAGTPSVPVVSGVYKVEYRTITSGEETAKALTLASLPATASYVSLDVISGGPQFFGTDFTVSGSTLSWAGLALDGVLVTGDKLRITYVN